MRSFEVPKRLQLVLSSIGSKQPVAAGVQFSLQIGVFLRRDDGMRGGGWSRASRRQARRGSAAMRRRHSPARCAHTPRPDPSPAPQTPWRRLREGQLRFKHTHREMGECSGCLKPSRSASGGPIKTFNAAMLIAVSRREADVGPERPGRFIWP